MKWTTGQQEILETYGNKGGEWCRNEIWREFGIWRSVDATEREAWRIGVSLMVYEQCPTCGRKTKKLMPTGECRVCRNKALAGEAREKRYAIERMDRAWEGGEDSEYEASKREFDRERQALSRARRRSRENVGKNVGLPVSPQEKLF